MPDPSANISCPVGVWVKAASGVRNAELFKIKSTRYIYTIRKAGESPPTDNGLEGTEGVSIFANALRFYKFLSFTEPTDIYVLCPNKNGVITVHPNSGDSAGGSPSVNTKVPADNFFIQANDVATTLVVDAVFDGKQIQVTNPASFSICDVVVITNPASIYFGEVLAVVGDIITLDSLLPFAYPAIGSVVQSYTKDMNVDGSVTPQTFSAFGPGAPNVVLNIVRLVFNSLTASAVDLSKFGDIVGGLTNGLLIRGVPNPASGLPPSNQFNAKTNGDLDTITGGDWHPYAATNPAQGQDGYTARYTYGGRDKHNTIPPLATGDRIDIIITDNLLTLLVFRTLFGGNTEFIQ